MRTALAALAAVPALSVLASAQAGPDLRDRITWLAADLHDLGRRYDAPMSEERRTRLRARLQDEAAAVAALDFAALPHDARIDWLLLDNHLRRELAQLDDEATADAQVAPVLPFAATIAGLCEARRHLEDVDAAGVASVVATIETMAERSQTELHRGGHDGLPLPVLQRAADRLAALRSALRGWFEFRDGYDPLFSWWVRTPFRDADEQLAALHADLRKRGSGADDSSLIGDPIGEAALLRELRSEWIPYTPAELVAIAEREFAWCDAEMAKAAAELHCADWREALTLVKKNSRAPGEQPALIRELAHEAIAFLDARELVTIPPLARECWRMSMMSREVQRTNPFFLGGQTIQVSFPVDAMTHDEKVAALRSNNEHFCRATVHHELIPGHWLQQWYQARWRPWREPFATPFWMEGWALYWEMRLYALGFAGSAADRVGMLYWRKHRCARIVFSLEFHLGRWTGPQCVDYLVDRVGHERAAAEAEVRRSVSGAYGPLYQAAYMLGGMQLLALHGEMVGSGMLTERAFHDRVLQQNSLPIAVLRAALSTVPPDRGLPAWRFADRR
ncbi:MAG: DUF885 family protein [Planctomycetota bacterium]